MPGMMDTILNLGLNDEAAVGLAAATGNKRFAYDSYRRLIQMYGEVVDGIDAYRFEQALSDLKNARGVTQDVELDGDDLAELVDDLRRDLSRRKPAGLFPHRCARAAAPRRPRRLRILGHAARAGLPRLAGHPQRPRHCGQRRADGLRQQGRRLAAPAFSSPATRRPASAACTASSSPTRRARTSSPASARRSRSRR